MVARDGGWTGERVRLSASEAKRAVATLGSRLLPECRDRFVTHLDLIFAHAVGMELARCRALADWQPVSARGSDKTRRRPPKGLPARLLMRLRDIQDRHGLLTANGADPADIAQFMQELRTDRELFWIVNLALSESSSQHLVLFRKAEHQKPLFEALGVAFQMSEDQVDGALRRGATDPALEQMTRGLAALYHDVTGELPGRTWVDASDSPEQGRFLALCRLLAEAVNQSLPKEFQRKKLPSMTKTVRRMVKEFKNELRSTPPL